MKRKQIKDQLFKIHESLLHNYYTFQITNKLNDDCKRGTRVELNFMGFSLGAHVMFQLRGK